MNHPVTFTLHVLSIFYDTGRLYPSPTYNYFY